MGFSDDPRQGPFDWGSATAPSPPPAPEPVPEPPTGPEGRRPFGGGFTPPVDSSRSPVSVKVAAVVAFVVVVALVVAVSVKVAVRDRVAPGRSKTVAPQGGAGSIVSGIGPAPGAELGPYLENRRQALGAAAGKRVAVVSFSRYTTESEARALAGDNPVKALLAAVPGGAPATVTTALSQWLDGEQSSIRSERDEIQKLLPTVTGDPEFKADYEKRVKELTDALNTVKVDSALVFGLVVEGPANGLRPIAAQVGVRMVDVAAPEAPTPDSDFRGIRPEETLKANDPPTRPV